MNKYFIGIDIGSTCAKTVVMNHEKEILHRFLQPTGWSSVDTAKQIQETLMEKGILPEESVVVATGSEVFENGESTEKDIECSGGTAYFDANR